MNYGYLFQNILSPENLLFFLLKLLALVTVFSLLAGVITSIKNSYSTNKGISESIQNVQAAKTDFNIKSIAWILLVGIGLLLLFTLYKMGNFNVSMYNILTSSLLMVAKLLLMVLIVSLTVATVLYAKKQYEAENLNLLKADTSRQPEIQNQTSDPNF